MKISKILATVSSPEGFYSVIPKDIKKNLRFRIELHKFLAIDIKAQAAYIQLCREYLPIVFDTTFFTLNPQMPPGERNRPFTLRPKQIPAVEKISHCIDVGKDVGLNKSRKQGASEIIIKTMVAKCLLEELANFIIGSRKKELVDNYGDNYTLFAKADNAINCLPPWWKELCGYDESTCRKDMALTIPSTQSAIVGETTNENFGAASRATAILLDEFGRVEYSIAESIEGSIHDISNCIIYNSTHWLGANHTFNKCLHKPSTEFISLMWYDNPAGERNGLYKTPAPGEIEIVDEKYYKDCIEDAIYIDSIGNYNLDEEKPQFICDGLKGIHSPYRSPWFDRQEYIRRGNRRDFVCNVCATPLGASDAPFDHELLQRIKEETIRPPDFEGELDYHIYSSGIMDEYDIVFLPGFGKKRLKWWGKLPFGRPDQKHNYVIGIDPSYGLGSANSAAVVMDVNTKEQVGSWVDSTTKPEDFADEIVALAYWCGGSQPTFLVWESNAGCGVNFTNRVMFHNYLFVYTQKREDSKTRKQVKKWGWASNEKAKESLLGELGVALSGGLFGDKKYKSFVIRDEMLLDELSDYVFKEKGKGIIQSSKADLSTGATERHGDRGIAAGLCVLGCKEQTKGDWKSVMKPPVNSFQHRYNEYMREEEKRKKDKRQFLF